MEELKTRDIWNCRVVLRNQYCLSLANIKKIYLKHGDVKFETFVEVVVESQTLYQDLQLQDVQFWTLKDTMVYKHAC